MESLSIEEYTAADVQSYVAQRVRDFGLTGWDIYVNSDTGEDHKSLGRNLGTCQMDLGSQQARIRINPDLHEDFEHMCETIDHELIHVILAPMDEVSMFKDLLPRKQRKLMDRLYIIQLEKVVSHLTKIL